MSNKLAVLLLVLLPCLACGQTQINTGGPSVLSINVNPSTVTITTGATATFQAIAVLTDGTQNIDVTQWCLWATSNGAIASFANAGIPTATGNSAGTVTVTCTYTVNGTTSNTASLTVSAPPIIINPPFGCTQPCGLPQGTNGTPYPGFTFQISGCTGTNNWTVQPNSPGNLNTGLSLNSSTGAITGTPTVTNTQTFTVQDACSAPAATPTVQVSLQVIAPPPCYTPPTSYCSPTDTSVQTWPSNPPLSLTGLLGANNIVTDCWISPDTNCWRVVRVTDYSISHVGGRTPSSGDSMPWMCSPTCGGSTNYFFHVINNGATWFSFNPSTFQTTNLGSVTSASDGTSFDPDSNDASRFNPGVFYSFGNIVSSTTVVPSRIEQYNVVSLAANPWTSANITHTTLLDPTGSTDPCNGLGNTETFLWNKSLWVGAGDMAAVNDNAGAGKGQVDVQYRYQSGEGTTIVVYDGSQATGHKCTWVNTLTGQMSIHGGTPFQMTGWGPIPPPTSAPTISESSTGGTFACGVGVINNFAVTYTLATVGETTLSPKTTFSHITGGTTCSYNVTSPPSATQPHLASVSTTGYNTYLCVGTPCNTSSSASWTMISSSTAPAQPVITSGPCSGAAGSTTYTYYVTAFNGSVESIPSAPFTSSATCPNKLTSSNFITINWNAVSGATSYWVCRNFITVCFSTTSTSFADKGGSPKQHVTQTNLIGSNVTIASPTGSLNPPTINYAGQKMHGTKIDRSGGWLNFSSAITSNAKVTIDLSNGASWTSGIGPSNLVPSDVIPRGDHDAWGSLTVMAPGTTGGGGPMNPVQYTMNDNPATVQSSGTWFLTGGSSTGSGSLTQPVDGHFSYPESANGDVLFSSNFQNAYALPLVWADGEVDGFVTVSTPATPYRFGRNYTTGLNGFYSQGIGQGSVDGKYFMFESDMCRNSTGVSACQAGSVAGLGSSAGTANCTVPNCRTDVFVIELK